MAVVVVVWPGHNLVVRPNCVVLGHSYYEDMHLALSIGDSLVDAMGKAVKKTSRRLMAGMSHIKDF
jgi:quinolinate synthase